MEKLYQLIHDKSVAESSDIEVLRLLVDGHPYFQAAIFLYLKTLYINDDENYDSELRRLSIAINDRRALFFYIFSEEYEKFFRETGKKDIKEDKTSVLLNAFFESRDDVETELDYNIISPGLATIDYLSYVETLSTSEVVEQPEVAEAEPVHLKHQDIIDSFITKSEEEGISIQIDRDTDVFDEDDYIEEEGEEGGNEELDENIFFTETLAKIYIKQKKYEKAYKIIKHLSLNYPKKNIYFADQLSFLEKLIINTKFKDKK